MSAQPLPPNVLPINPQAAQANQANLAAWGTSGGGYDPLTYYVAARNSSTGTAPGQYESMRVKMPTWLHRVCMGMVGDPQFPQYKSPDDIVRDGLYHLFNLREAQKGGPTTPAIQDAITRFQQEQDLFDARDKLDHDKRILTEARELAEEYVSYGMWESLQKLVNSQRDKSDHWEGDLRSTMMRLCDEYERKIPADIRAIL